jgi:2-polyprenyl-6-hydroxyphenyl methylase/3-demethylubiquinone-9 3-methyltransferase
MAGHACARTVVAMWGLGDYHRFATTMVWSFGPELVTACGIGPGQRVLDVATGTGNVALRAAEAGAEVVASDLEPAQLAAGRRAAQARGLALEWVEADAAALPFADDAFDAVTSSAGAIFAPDQAAVADELVRVCKPGGTIGMINFTPGSMADAFFAVFGRHAPSNGAPSPILWGDEAHVRALFGSRVALDLSRRSYVERSPGGPREFCAFYKATFGPVVGLYAALDADAAAALDADFLDFARTWARTGADGHAEYDVEYLLVVGRVA